MKSHCSSQIELRRLAYTKEIFPCVSAEKRASPMTHTHLSHFLSNVLKYLGNTYTKDQRQKIKVNRNVVDTVDFLEPSPKESPQKCEIRQQFTHNYIKNLKELTSAVL